MVFGKNIHKIAIIILSIFLLNACASKNKLLIEKKSFSNLQFWQHDNHLHALNTFINGCKNYDKKGWHNFSRHTSNHIKPDLYSKYCKLANNSTKNDKTAKLFFETNFIPYLISNNGKEIGVFTGYHEPIIMVSHHKNKKFKYPIYSKPTDLNKKRSYYSRKEIESGVLKNRKLEIAYTNDPIELFFLQIQGSGIMQYENGTQVRIGYDGQNGHPYYAIGKYLIEKENIPAKLVNAIFIKNWLKKHKHKANMIMNKNASYVFFRVNKKNAAIGSQNIPLTKERSLAIDRKYIPLGSLLWMEVHNPSTNHSINKLMVTQDTGGAIKGCVRADIFFGSDKQAAYKAAMMKGLGKYFILLPKHY